ncbi:aminoacyl-tRNA deacylase [Clostridium sp. WILCCON 0269]|uniref:Aminoacyl-tRNA deacylase n=1 Tax=Candidatus Clostridium eludens TaxID=3381663 RepID=A0ABW8SMG4_9CLOT
MERIKSLLVENNFEFEFIHHDKLIHTAQEGADYFKITIGQTAPALIIYTNIGFHALIISGSEEKLNFKKIKKLLKCTNVRMATKNEVKELTGFCVGTIPLFGLPFPYIIDKKLLQKLFIYGGTGEEHYTLKVNPNALIKLNNVVGILD